MSAAQARPWQRTKRSPSVLDPYKPAIDRIVAEDAQAPRRRSVRAICEELGITGVSQETVWSYMRAARRALQNGARR